ncbi:MAG: hypothetical protein SGI92_26360 [Bryobacteraceae bacterium]|nr:hypothetical protein [Bryobacteraceae bacterium]
METRRLTRRQLGFVAAAAAVPVGSAGGQEAAAPAAAAGDLEQARAERNRRSATLRKMKLPQLLEPSFVFRP